MLPRRSPAFFESYSSELMRGAVLTVGHMPVGGWQVGLSGPYPLRCDHSFTGDLDARERGYAIAREHLLAHGVTDVAPFDSLEWTRHGKPEPPA